jgi:shikimate kinase/3-dehydroquinate synthase
MGAGKSTAARELGGIDADDLVESAAGMPIAELFREEGEATFRALEEQTIVLALGAGAVTSPAVRDALGDALTIWLDVDVDTCWERVKGSDRPLAQDEAAFRRLYEERRALYADVADVVAHDADDVVLAAAGIHVERGALQRLGELVPGQGSVALVSDRNVAGIHGMDTQLALGARLTETHELPPGEEAKTLAAVDRLWQDLRLDRSGTIVALGGGCTTDAAGLAAATYLRGIAWTPVPTSLVAQVDAAVGGKTAIDLPQGKNLVGAFHWPERTVIDPALLDTLPEPQRLEGMAEVVKTGLRAGESVWALPEA